MYKIVGLVALCLALSGCYYPYPYGYGYQYGYGYGYPSYRYAPPAYPYATPAPGYPYGAYPAPNNYPRTLGPTGDTPGAAGSP
jgi:hypothetical protein